MLKINFKVIRNGLSIIDANYGEFNNFVDAANAISNDVEELSNSKEGYFSQFNTKLNETEDDYKFTWNCDWNSIDEIIDCGHFRIYDGINFVRWEIVADTSNDIADKEKALKMP